MLLFVLRKMAANRWMVASLLVGVILAVAMVTTIPIYSRGILTRLLMRDLQIYQETSGFFPGSVRIEGYQALDPEAGETLAGFDELTEAVDREVRRGIVAPITTSSQRLQQNYLRLFDPRFPEDDPVSTGILSAKGFFERVRPALGEMPRAARSDDTPVLEAVITRETAASGKMTYGQTYDLFASRGEVPLPYRVEIVGVVEVADPSDVFWTYPIGSYRDLLIFHEEDVRRVITNDNPTRNLEAGWNYTYDYHALSSEHAAPMVDFVDEYTQIARKLGFSVRVPAYRILQDYMVRERALVMTLWVLQVPLLIMLAFYLFMVSQVLIDHERNEIALMKSRGADVGQVFFTYVLLGLMLAVAGVLAGPFLGLVICQILGASNGFLEFVQRRALQLEITGRTWLYGSLAATVALVTILVPALQASRTTIVHHKQRRARGKKRPLWKILFLDLLLIAVSVYGLYRYRERETLVQLTGLEGTELALDPVLLFVSTLFVLGLGLLFLRFYPLLIRLLYRAGAKRWPPAVFASLIQVGRGGGKDQFLMLFLILSISIGVYNADAARTLNLNVEERTRYNIGADIVVKEEWRQVADPNAAPAGPAASGGFGMNGGSGEPEEAGRYVEPEFRRFEELEGVEAATRVFYEPNASGREFGGESFTQTAVFGIVPQEFGTVGWFRHDLLPAHWYNYLNLLSESPAAALVSRSLAEEAKIEPGDPIYITWADQPATLYYVYGLVDYWPGYNPHAARFASGSRHLAVVNLNYLHANTALEPYEVWLDLEDGAGSATIYEEFTDAGIRPVRLLDAQQELIRERNDPMLQGTNGTLSLGFLVSLGVCFVGFLLYWTFSIRERTLQFGLFRAMGMSRAAIVAMLGCEQLFISGAAVVAGFGIGRLASRLFVPMLQVIRNAAQTVPPIRVVSLLVDELRIAAFVVVMLFLGFGILSVFLFRIRIHQAVKLGEE
ncbi:MAG: ABC transporter permease [Spirochaetota bacterium]